VTVTGTGGGGTATSCTAYYNYGVIIEEAGTITAGGTGKVVVNGTGGNGTSGANIGVVLSGTCSITSSGGDVFVSGTGGGNYGSSPGNSGIVINNEGVISSGGSGAVTVTGVGKGLDANNNHGVYILDIGSMITSGGTGSVTVTGYGGNTAGTSGDYNYGVNIDYGGQVASGGGPVLLNGTGGGGTSTSTYNHGVYVVGSVSSGGTGSVTVEGQSGSCGDVPDGDGITSIGIYIEWGSISSEGGNVVVTGRGNPDSNGTDNVGLYVYSGVTITSGSISGTVTVFGYGGGTNSKSGSGNDGIWNSGEITSGGATVTITGIEGNDGNAIWSEGSMTTTVNGGNLILKGNSMWFDDSDYTPVVAASDANSVTILPYTPGVGFNLGSSVEPSGGPISLQQSELNCISGGMIYLGDTGTGSITISVPVEFTSTVTLTTPATGGLYPKAAGTDLSMESGKTLSMAPGWPLVIAINGTISDTGYDAFYLNCSLSLTGGTLSLTGTYAPNIGDEFTIVSSTMSVTGTFTGLAEGDVVPFNGYDLVIHYTDTEVILNAPGTIWDGSESTDWFTAANWDMNVVPVAGDNVFIPDGVPHDPLIYTGTGTLTVCNSLTIEPGAIVTIAPGNSLTISSTLTNNSAGGVVIQSDASGTGSLIIGAASGTGTITVERYMPGRASAPYPWHIISSPVIGQSLTASLMSEWGVASNLPSNPNRKWGFGIYSEPLNAWNYYPLVFTGDVFPMGIGYVMARLITGTITFTGTPQATDLSVTLTRSSGATGSVGWNSAGNPFTSAISVSDFLTTNGSKLDASYRALYVWNPDDLVYDIVTGGSTNPYIPVGQGFCVNAGTNSATVNFLKTMRTHEPTAPFKSGASPWPGIALTVATKDMARTTVVNFNPAMTTGLDPMYDAGLFKSGGALEYYTRLVEDNGVDFGIQCLPDTGFDKMVVPLGIDLKAGGELTFTAGLTNLPNNCQPVLEDRLLGLRTDLTKNGAAYHANLPANSTGTGRFYLHLSGSTGIPEISEANLKVYSVTREIYIEGTVNTGSIATLYDLTGRSVGSYKLQAADFNILKPVGIPEGIYLIRILDKVTVKYAGKVSLQ
jgi:hypothetical protein